MQFHSLYGPSVPERGWVPAPRYLLRRDRIRKLLRELAPGRVLEIGCGAGTLLRELAADGFQCTGVESSPAAYELARYVNDPAENVTVTSEMPSEGRAFDYLLAFEVLEHIDKDESALAAWAAHLRPGGRMLLSVPAHQKRWSASDVWAGHFRRYERAALVNLVERTGFEVEKVECYGFPLANLLSPLAAYKHSRELVADKELDSEEDRAKRTARSGVNRDLIRRMYALQASWVGTILMRICFGFQAMSCNSELGNGYILRARLK